MPTNHNAPDSMENEHSSSQEQTAERPRDGIFFTLDESGEMISVDHLRKPLPQTSQESVTGSRPLSQNPTHQRSSSKKDVPPAIDIHAAQSNRFIEESPLVSGDGTQTSATPLSGRSIFSEQRTPSFGTNSLSNSTSSLLRNFASRFQSAASRAKQAGRLIESPDEIKETFVARIVEKDDSRLYLERINGRDHPTHSPLSPSPKDLPPLIEITASKHPAFFSNKNINELSDVIQVKVGPMGTVEIENLTNQERDFEQSARRDFNIVEPSGAFMAKVICGVGSSIYVHRILEMQEGTGPADNLYKIDMSNATSPVTAGEYVHVHSIRDKTRHTVAITPALKREEAMEQAAIEFEETKLSQSVENPTGPFAGRVFGAFGDNVYVRAEPRRIGRKIALETGAALVRVNKSAFPPGMGISVDDYVRGNVVIDQPGKARPIAVSESRSKDLDPQPLASPSSSLTMGEWLKAAERQATINRAQHQITTTVKIGGQQAKARLISTKNPALEPTVNSRISFDSLSVQQRGALLEYVAAQCPNAQRFSIQKFNPQKSFTDYAFPVNEVLEDADTKTVLVYAKPRQAGANQDAIAKIIPVPVQYAEQLKAAMELTMEQRNSTSVAQSHHRNSQGSASDVSGHGEVGTTTGKGHSRR